jgi:hypothetical protein
LIAIKTRQKRTSGLFFAQGVWPPPKGKIPELCLCLEEKYEDALLEIAAQLDVPVMELFNRMIVLETCLSDTPNNKPHRADRSGN